MLRNGIELVFLRKKKGCILKRSPVLKSSRQKLNDFKIASFKAVTKKIPRCLISVNLPLSNH